MSYNSLYRQYRPQSFTEVVGQTHITDTLVNQIKNGRVGHAYLFTGSRGVGKTTCARIFAQAINCISPVNGSPCRTCEVCSKLADPVNLDITEIDAASNNGVDDARELRERVKYPPVHGKYKVFIIDEAHMLTGSAFNALLKTLEEPPAHVVFVLATTEAYKLPATILSRVMRFDFRLLPVSEIERVVSGIYKELGKDYEPEAVKYIATLGEGSVRDALSVADRCIGATEGRLTYSAVLQLLGAAGSAQIKNLVDKMAKADAGGALEAIDSLIKSGKSAAMIAKDILSYTRDLLIARTAPSVLELPEQDKKELVAIAKEYSAELLVSFMQAFSSIEQELRYSVSVRTVLETACLKACKLYVSGISALEERIARLEKQSAAIQQNPSAYVSAPSVSVPVAPAQTNATQEVGGSARAAWGRIITVLRNSPSKMVYAIVSEVSEVVLIDGILKIHCNRNNFLSVSAPTVLAEIKKAAESLGYSFGIETELVDREEEMDKEIRKLKKMVGDVPFRID